MSDIALSSDLKQIELEINFYKNSAGMALIEIGKRLCHVKEQDLAHGQFMNWVAEQGLNQRTANKLMAIANNLSNWTTSSNLGIEALYLIATLPDEVRDAETTTATGEVKPPAEMTVKELRALNQAVKTATAVDDQPEEPAAMAPVARVAAYDSKPPNRADENLERITELEAELAAIKAHKQYVEGQYSQLLASKDDNQAKAAELDAMKAEIAALTQQRSQYSREVRSIQNFVDFGREVDELLLKVSPIIYQGDFQIINNSQVMRQNYLTIVEKVQKWCDDMYAGMQVKPVIEGQLN